MAIVKVDHISITAVNADEVISFYSGNFGFHLESSEDVENLKMKVYKLRKGDDVIEILSPYSSEGKTSEGLKHMALLSDNIDEDFKFCRESGMKLLHNEVQKHSDVQFFFVKSPSGEYVEILQYAK